MRHTFRKHPKVQVKMSRPAFVLGDALDYGTRPGYDWAINTICLNHASEKHIIRSLNHEIAHWVMFGFLTAKEIEDSTLKTLHWQLLRAPLPLIEEIASWTSRRER